MIGMNRITGRQISAMEHLKQSIEDILTTPKGTRVMLREYGSDLPRLVDAPMNRETILDMISASAEAINLWETRIKVTQIKPTEITEGRIIFQIIGEYTPDGSVITLDGIKVK